MTVSFHFHQVIFDCKRVCICRAKHYLPVTNYNTQSGSLPEVLQYGYDQSRGQRPSTLKCIAVSPGATHPDSFIVFVTGRATVVKRQLPLVRVWRKESLLIIMRGRFIMACTYISTMCCGLAILIQPLLIAIHKPWASIRLVQSRIRSSHVERWYDRTVRAIHAIYSCTIIHI